jgi:hypothetical protein
MVIFTEINVTAKKIDFEIHDYCCDAMKRAIENGLWIFDDELLKLAIKAEPNIPMEVCPFCRAEIEIFDRQWKEAYDKKHYQCQFFLPLCLESRNITFRNNPRNLITTGVCYSDEQREEFDIPKTMGLAVHGYNEACVFFKLRKDKKLLQILFDFFKDSHE